MEITITPRRIVLALVVLALLAAGGLALSRREGGLPLLPAEDTPTPPPSATPDPLSDEAARGVVEQAITAFFTADYADPAGWLKQFEALSPPETVLLLREFYQPLFWPDLEKGRIRSTARLLDAEKLAEKPDPVTGDPMQLWRYRVQVEPPWPGEGPEVNGYMVVAAIDGRWQFVTFMSEREVQEILAETAEEAP